MSEDSPPPNPSRPTPPQDAPQGDPAITAAQDGPSTAPLACTSPPILAGLSTASHAGPIAPIPGPSASGPFQTQHNQVRPMRAICTMPPGCYTAQDAYNVSVVYRHINRAAELAIQVAWNPSVHPYYWPPVAGIWRYIHDYQELQTLFYDSGVEQMYWQALASHAVWNRDTNDGACTCPACLATPAAGPSFSSVTPAAATSTSSTLTPAAPTATTPIPASEVPVAPAPAAPPKSSTLVAVDNFPGLAPTSKPVDDPNVRPKVSSVPNTKGKLAASSNKTSSHPEAALTLRAHEQTRSVDSKASAKTVGRRAWDVRNLSHKEKENRPDGKLPIYRAPRLTEDPNSLDDGVRWYNQETRKVMTFHYDIKRLGLLHDEDPSLCSGVFGGGVECPNLATPEKCAFHHDVAPDFFKTVIENRDAKTEVQRMVNNHNKRRYKSGAVSLSVPNVTSALGPSQSTSASIIVPVSQAPAHIKSKMMTQNPNMVSGYSVAVQTQEAKEAAQRQRSESRRDARNAKAENKSTITTHYRNRETGESVQYISQPSAPTVSTPSAPPAVSTPAVQAHSTPPTVAVAQIVAPVASPPLVPATTSTAAQGSPTPDALDEWTSDDDGSSDEDPYRSNV